MIFRLFTAGFVLLLVLVSWLAIGHWYWYRDIGLKHKHQCALQSTWVWTRIAGLYSWSCFIKTTTIVLLFFASNRRIKGIRRGPVSVPRLKNMIRRFESTGDLGIAPGEADGQLRQKLLKLLLPWLRMLDAMCDLQAVKKKTALRVKPSYPCPDPCWL